MAALRGHRRAVYGTGAAVVVIVAVTIGLVLANQPAPGMPVVYTNISRNFKTCLLTTTADNSTVWTAIQAAARNRPINAQHVVAPSGPAGELVPYLNSLLALHCQLIVTAGPDLAGPLATVAKTHPGQRFANISKTSTGLPNVHDLPDDTTTTIAELVTTACGCR